MSVESPPSRLQKPNDHHGEWLLRRIWDRIHRDGEHFMGVIVGREGSGKSYTAMKIAHEIDPTFAHGRVIFDVVELLERLRDGEHEPGQFYVLDEAGVQLGVRTWHQRGQVLTNQALQLVRNHNLGLLFTLPRLGELDSQAQGRLQAFLELTDKEPGEYVGGKWKWLQPDRTDRTGTVYHHFPRRREDGRVLRLTSIRFSPPPEELTEPYEERKREFQMRFYEKTIRELRDDEEDEDGEALAPGEVVDRLESEDDLEPVVSLHGTTGEPYIDADLLQMEYDLSTRDARKAKKLAEKRDILDPSTFE